MPNTREKLIDLLTEIDGICPNEENCYHCKYDNEEYCFAHAKADFLISNGVTVQQWIPVTERLPEDCGSYIVVVKYKYDHEKEYDYGVDVATYYTYDNPDAYIDNHWDTYNDWYEGQQYIHITHWMPLPEKPKGD